MRQRALAGAEELKLEEVCARLLRFLRMLSPGCTISVTQRKAARFLNVQRFLDWLRQSVSVLGERSILFLRVASLKKQLFLDSLVLRGRESGSMVGADNNVIRLLEDTIVIKSNESATRINCRIEIKNISEPGRFTFDAVIILGKFSIFVGEARIFLWRSEFGLEPPIEYSYSFLL